MEKCNEYTKTMIDASKSASLSDITTKGFYSDYRLIPMWPKKNPSDLYPTLEDCEAVKTTQFDVAPATCGRVPIIVDSDDEQPQECVPQAVRRQGHVVTTPSGSSEHEIRVGSPPTKRVRRGTIGDAGRAQILADSLRLMPPSSTTVLPRPFLSPRVETVKFPHLVVTVVVVVGLSLYHSALRAGTSPERATSISGSRSPQDSRLSAQDIPPVTFTFKFTGHIPVSYAYSSDLLEALTSTLQVFTTMDSILEIQRQVPATADEWRVKSARREKLNFFWEPNHYGLWSSPNARQLLLPIPDANDKKDIGSIYDYCCRPHKTRWLQNPWPFLGFWPIHVTWTGPFACLRLIYGRIPISMAKRGTGHGYHLYSDLVSLWETLEAKLVCLSTGLVRKNLTTTFEWAEMRVPVLPYECGYRGLHARSDDAIRAAFASRNAFVALFAFLSFTIALDMAHNPAQGNPPSWLVYAEKELGLDAPWLNDIHQSFICHFVPGVRPGLYTHCNNIAYKQVFPAFIIGRVPLFICWGFRPLPLKDEDLMWRYRPCQAEARAAIDSYCDRLPRADDPRTSMAFWYNMPLSQPWSQHHHSTPTSSLPAPSSYTGTHLVFTPTNHDEESPLSPPSSPTLPTSPPGQSLLETEPLEWLKQHDREPLEAVERESEEEVRQRLQDEAIAQADKIDKESVVPRVGDSMYEWIRTSPRDYQQATIRREDWKNVWGSYMPEERFYLPKFREWHLVRTSSPATPLSHFTANLLRQPPVPNTNKPKTLKELGSLPIQPEAPEPDVDSAEYLQNCYTATTSDYGSSSETENETSSKESSKKRKNSQKHSKRRKRLGPLDNRMTDHLQRNLEGSKPLPIPPSVSRCVVNSIRRHLFDTYGLNVPTPYAGELRRKDGKEDSELEDGEIGWTKKPTNVMTVLWRLGVGSVALEDDMKKCLVDLYDFVMKIESPSRLSSPLWDLSPSLFSKISKHEYFLYRRLNEDFHVIGVTETPLTRQWFLLVIFDPRAVVELFRKGISSVRAMMRHLVDRGIAFYTARPTNCLRHPRTDQIPGLGYFAQGHEFTSSDFAEYQKRRSEILSASHGRAAIMTGGIIWRLALDVVNIKTVLGGPSSNAKQIGELDGYALIDDIFSEEVEDVVCGVYKVYTGFDKQTEDASWFPKASAWQKSGNNHGYWTADNEDWYQKRLQEISNGGKPRNAHEWRGVLTAQRANPVHAFCNFFAQTNDRLLVDDKSYWVD
ncbi:hypothetical protein C0995_014640 [Termitomyces sp. Mi166|nr:hypothetical protein C0995_014640 [Termitomyces sp. Mi166\